MKGIYHKQKGLHSKSLSWLEKHEVQKSEYTNTTIRMGC